VFCQSVPFRNNQDGDKHADLTTGTCVNLLKMPIYKDSKTLKEKLLYSVHSNAGFDLS
jgi:hypothetical protein